ncbi:MAG: TrkH family potassium uptake protein [Acidimicrobiia bacterium]|nr:TrkH family potassium uptake protein [Acidimicrobiia bacterium]
MYVIGAVITASALGTVPAILTGVVYREWDDVLGLLLAAVCMAAIGVSAWRGFGRSGRMSTREGLAVVGLSWFAMVVVGTLPYFFTQSIGGVTNTFFETAAGFTTTGASILPDPGVLSHAMLIWRATTQWVGGMGIIVLFVAVLPLLGVGGVELARAESPGPEPDRLTPRFQDTAKRLWLIYVGLTAGLFVLLALGDMSMFEAIAHSLTTISTGGFSTEPGSIGAFSAYSQWMIALFIFVSATSFALHYRAKWRPARYVENAEFRLYAGTILTASILIALGLASDLAIGDTIRDAVFSALTLVTGTGFATSDFGQWTAGLQILAVSLMFLGGMAGSTAGAVKTYRMGVLYKSSAASLKKLAYPSAVIVPRFGGRPIPDSIVRNIQLFFLFYMITFVTGTVLLALIDAAAGNQASLVTTTTAVVSAIGNIGPGLAEVGPGGTYLVISDAGKWLLSFLMIVGRLEIFPVVLLFTRFLWK